jgi:hypothetical protein
MDKDIIHTDWSHLRNDNSNSNNNNQNSFTSVTDINGSAAQEVKQKPFFFWFFISGLLLLIIAVLFFSYKYYFDQNKVSSDKISFTNNISDTNDAGVVNFYQININNSNKANIKDVKVRMSYQKGYTREGELDTVNKEFTFGDIIGGMYVATSSDYVLIGKEGDIRKIKMTLNYKVEGSNAEFSKTFEKEIKIASPLATVKISGSQNIIEDHENVFLFKVKNLSLKDFIQSVLIIESPDGFIVKRDGDINPTRFEIPSLKIGEEKEFKLTGFFKNNVGQTKNIRGYLAELNEKGEAGSSYASDVLEVDIINSPINYKIEVNVQGEKRSYFTKDKENKLELSLQNSSSDFISEVNVILTNKNTKEEIKWDNKSDDVLIKIDPDKTIVISKIFTEKNNSLVLGQNNYILEVYGKRRGEFNSILLKKSELGIVMK